MCREQPTGTVCIIVLLMFTLLQLMPLSRAFWDAESRQHWRFQYELVSGAFVGISFIANQALFAIPWFVIRVASALEAIRHFELVKLSDLGELALVSSRVFPAIGAAWLVAHRANWTPWNFDPLIVLLTAAHFHHAGFTLPLMAGLNAKASPGCWTRFSCVAILAGVPLVAAGITCTHFGVLRFAEPFGVTVLVLGALGVAVSQIRRGFEKMHTGWVRVCFVISGVSLLAAMILAMGFGLRHVMPDWALTMPQMWMIHGTLNAFGFGLCGLLAWRDPGSSKKRNTPNSKVLTSL
jgi:hypothetical protein